MRLLVLYHGSFTYVPATHLYVDAWRRYSRHAIEYFDIRRPIAAIRLADYDAIWVNYCVRASGLQGYALEPITQALAQYHGRKLIALQDEYDFTNATRDFLLGSAADVVATCVPQAAISQIYPGVPAHFETVLTGYITDELIKPALPLALRPIVVGYRGRELPYRLGDLGWHKAELARQFEERCTQRGIAHDIAYNEQSRIYGEAWFTFLRNCQVVLGSPSGSNVFDFDGSIHKWMTAHWRPGLRYDQVRAEIMAHAQPFDMGQVSPRIFEAIMARAALALVRGSYSGVIEPELHYVPIEPDYSNIQAVLDRIQDTAAMQAMADRTHAHVVGNPANHYQHFIARMDDLAEVEQRVAQVA